MTEASIFQSGTIVNTRNSSGGAWSMGDGVVAGDQLRVCAADIPNNDDGPTFTSGVHELPAATADTWSDGDDLFWDSGSEYLTTTAGSVYAGKAVGDKSAGSTSQSVLLCPGGGVPPSDSIGTAQIEDDAIGADQLDQIVTGAHVDDIADGGQSVPFVIQKTFGDADGDVTIYNTNAPFKFRIIDAWVENRAANGANANTVQVCADTGGADAITDAMSLNGVADEAIVRAGSVDDTTGIVAANGSLYLDVVKAGGAMGGNVYILAVRVA